MTCFNYKIGATVEMTFVLTDSLGVIATDIADWTITSTCVNVDEDISTDATVAVTDEPNALFSITFPAVDTLMWLDTMTFDIKAVNNTSGVVVKSPSFDIIMTEAIT